MTGDAECADVLEIRIAAFADRHDVISFPQRFARATATRQQACIEVADRADPAVAFEYTVAEIGGARSQPPFVHALVGAERSPFPAHLACTPATQSSAVCTTPHRFHLLASLTRTRPQQHGSVRGD